MEYKEAKDLNTLLAYALSPEAAKGFRPSDARNAAMRLADAAYTQLSAGLNGEDVRRKWASSRLRPTRPPRFGPGSEGGLN